MRLFNDGDRYNSISFAAANVALASRWLQRIDDRPMVDSPPVFMSDPNRQMRRHHKNRRQQGLI